MLHLFVSNYNPQARTDLTGLVQTLTKDAPDTPVFRFEGDIDALTLEEYRGTQGLFATRSIVVLDEVCVNATQRDAVLDALETLKDSPNTFIVFENTLDKRIEKKIAPYAERVHSYHAEKKQEVKEGDIFAITDAVGARDRKKAWTELHKLLFSGKSAEEIHGMVFWQFKNMQLVQSGQADASTLGMKPFVFNKARKYASNFDAQELRRYAQSLVEAYHAARQGGPELPIALERFSLSL